MVATSRRKSNNDVSDKEGPTISAVAHVASKDRPERKIHPSSPLTKVRNMRYKLILIAYSTVLCYTGCMAFRDLLVKLDNSINSRPPEPNNDFQPSWNELWTNAPSEEWYPIGSTEYPYTDMAPQLDVVWARGWYNAMKPPETVPIGYYNKAGLSGRATKPTDLDRFFPEHQCGTFWLRTEDLQWWIHNRLPQMNCPFTLITGDSIKGVPSGTKNAHQILEHPYLDAWYAQNVVDASHPKLKPIPVGLPIHYGFPGSPSSVTTVAQMIHIREHMPAFANRSRRILFDPGTMKGNDARGKARREAYDQLSMCQNNGTQRVQFMPPTPTVETWKKHYSTHQFAIVVRGTGWDTYRTWEYLLYGTVPILLKGTPMDHLHRPAHTPVVFVDAWADICQWDDAFYAKLEARYEQWIANAHKWLRPSLWVPRNQTEMERLCDTSPGCREEPLVMKRVDEGFLGGVFTW